MQTTRDKTGPEDERGAVMVIAVFMAAFLVGVLWYVIGIGDAIVYRETLQDGADATAFAAAVYHARGMNVVAMLNMIMAAVLAVLVALKIAQVLLVIANAISCALSWTGAGAAVCAATSAAEEPLQSVIDSTENVVDKVLRGLDLASGGIAVGMPWVAEAKAVTVAGDHAPTVHGGFIVSASLVPVVELGPASSSSGGGGTRLGLPIVEDDFPVVCGRAGRDVAALALAPFAAFGIPTEWAQKFVQAIVSTFPGYFCGGSGQGFDGVIESVSKETCDRTKEQVERYNHDNPSRAQRQYDETQCLESARKDAAKRGLDSKGLAKGQSRRGSAGGKASKKVYEAAKNGDDYFGIWALAWGDLKAQSGAPRGVEIAAWNQEQVRDPSFLSKAGFAKAEFYYDIESDGRRPAWSDYKDDAMWNMRWRARLRRVRSPMSGLGEIVGGKLGGKIADYVAGDSDSARMAIDWVKEWPALDVVH